MMIILWLYGAGAVSTGALWLVFTQRALRNADSAKRRAAEVAFQWRYFVLVLLVWPLALAWGLRHAIRVAKSNA